ncbi:DnaA regulatory inactivator Hda [Alcanivorax sp. JB21]|uniref:DnaA regulatory inactivator Hda n=1 Tax=Alcanivorax limicola TaxID=2874102 RepID=UPI001CBCFD6F|nr:DnaA regulatory inactivator Hda [Alcanivorax limicola]MBZ2188301.1 DnaA regulatory inactivator Hda [Alcanivorax limicola]
MDIQLPLALRLRDGADLDSLLGARPLVAAVQALVSGELNQLYVHGDVGSGRTHLLSAAVREAENRGLTACLLPGEELGQLPPEVLEDFEHFALIAIDNIDELAGQRAWEEALFHLYNRCQDTDAACLFAARSAPASAGFGLADLSSRLAAGPVYRLPVLAEDDLVALLCQRATRRGLSLNADVAGYIVLRGERTPAALLALLDTLDEHALVRQRRLTIPFVKEVLGW